MQYGKLGELQHCALSHLQPVNTRHPESPNPAARPDLRHYDYCSRHVSDACHRAYCPQDHRRVRHQKLSAVLLHVALVTYYSKKKTHFHGFEKRKDARLDIP